MQCSWASVEILFVFFLNINSTPTPGTFLLAFVFLSFFDSRYAPQASQMGLGVSWSERGRFAFNRPTHFLFIARNAMRRRCEMAQ
uniref:Putative secreted protein n=1 Tax=Anopheles darlingi TaxID=43151 RepID=A0A2M4DHW0_ANODA